MYAPVKSSVSARRRSRAFSSSSVSTCACSSCSVAAPGQGRFGAQVIGAGTAAGTRGLALIVHDEWRTPGHGCGVGVVQPRHRNPSGSDKSHVVFRSRGFRYRWDVDPTTKRRLRRFA
ncbi:Uncharacterised protein [Bordetella pertussis]|nr:Uncharacterised protein [Bordetella pertussis]